MKGIEFRLAQRKNGYFSACEIASLYSDLEEKDQAFLARRCLSGVRPQFVVLKDLVPT